MVALEAALNAALELAPEANVARALKLVAVATAAATINKLYLPIQRFN